MVSIGAAAKASGLPVKTIHYYETIGLIEPPRSERGYRRYGESDLHDLKFIASCRSLGFTIADCRALLDLYRDTDRASADVKQLAERHLQRTHAKIAELERIRDALEALVEGCDGDHRPDCPILEGLAHEGAKPQEAA